MMGQNGTGVPFCFKQGGQVERVWKICQFKYFICLNAYKKKFVENEIMSIHLPCQVNLFKKVKVEENISYLA